MSNSASLSSLPTCCGAVVARAGSLDDTPTHYAHVQKKQHDSTNTPYRGATSHVHTYMHTLARTCCMHVCKTTHVSYPLTNRSQFLFQHVNLRWWRSGHLISQVNEQGFIRSRCLTHSRVRGRRLGWSTKMCVHICMYAEGSHPSKHTHPHLCRHTHPHAHTTEGRSQENASSLH